MARYEVEVCDGEWEAVESYSPEAAARSYTRDHAESEGWSDCVELKVRDEYGDVFVCAVEWRVEMVVDVVVKREVQP